MKGYPGYRSLSGPQKRWSARARTTTFMCVSLREHRVPDQEKGERGPGGIGLLKSPLRDRHKTKKKLKCY